MKIVVVVPSYNESRFIGKFLDKLLLTTRVVIVVDDGLATGATMIAALHSVRARNPQRLICAVPVGAPESLEAVSSFADEVVCLYAPAFFDAVGRFYAHFDQVEDDEVIRWLSASDAPRPSGRPAG